MNFQEKVNRINELLESKDITVQDDYFTDIFCKSETNEFLFKVSSQRNTSEKESEEILDEIIIELEKL